MHNEFEFYLRKSNQTKGKPMKLVVAILSLLALSACSNGVTRYNTNLGNYDIMGDYYGAGGSASGSYGPYTPSIPTLRYGKSRDFQGGGGDK